MRLAAAIVSLILGGCAHHRRPAPPPVAASGPAFVELEAGWRVRVITPKLKSGGFLLKKAEQQETGNTIALRAGDEFLGFETATYGVTAGKDDGIRVALTEVEFNHEGTITRPAKSFAPRLRIPGRFRRVRLLYMQKVSDADHAMAVLAAPDSQKLAALTQRLQTAPETGCRTNRSEYCEWIPAGVALRAERPLNQGWGPAR